MHTALVLAALLAAPAAAQDYVLQLEYETETTSEEGDVTNGSSGRQPIAERILAATPDGIEAEFSLPFDPEDIRGNERWMFRG